MSATEQVKGLLRIERKMFQGGSVGDLVFYMLGIFVLTVFTLFAIQYETGYLFWGIISLFYLALFVGLLLLTLDVMRRSTIIVSREGIEEIVGSKLRNSIRWGPDVQVRVETEPVTNKRLLLPLKGIEIFGSKGKIITVSVDDGWTFTDVRTLVITIAKLTDEMDIKMDRELIAYNAQLANRAIDSPH